MLSPQRRTRHALVQTPHFVADLILDETLVPAADTFRDEQPLRLIDPAAGTGHFLIRAVDYLWQWYTTGRITTRQITGRRAVTGGTVYPAGPGGPADPGRRRRRRLDPLTAAVGPAADDRLHSATSWPRPGSSRHRCAWPASRPP